MAQPVLTDHRQPGPTAGPLHHVTDQVSADRAACGPAGQEQVPIRARPTRSGQVAGQRPPDVIGQRHPVLPVCLAADHQLTGPPVDIAQLQPGDLDRPEPEPDQQRQDREVPHADRRGPVAAIQQRRDVGGGHRRGHRHLPPPRDRRHRLRQRQLRHAADRQEPQHRPELSDPALRRPDRHPAALAEQEPMDVSAGQPLHVQLATSHGVLGQEPTGGVDVAQDRHRRQTTLGDHPQAVLIEQPRQRRRRRRRRRGHPGLPQIAQQRPHPARSRHPTATPGPPHRQELRYPLLIELRRLQVGLGQPHPHLPQILEHVRHRQRRVPPLLQPRPIVLDVTAQPTRLPARARHRPRPLAGARCPRRRLVSASDYAEAARTLQRTTAIQQRTRPPQGATSA